MTNPRFHEDGSFRVLQMADTQDDPSVLPDTIRLIREATCKADPDLVVFTGDQIRGYDPAYIGTLLHRCGEELGARMRAIIEVEAKLRGIRRRTRSRVSNRLPAMKSDGSNPDAQQTASTVSTTPALVCSITSDPQDVPTTLDELMDKTRDKIRRTFADFLGPVIEAEVPSAITYGSHDLQYGILADEWDGIHHEFPGCLNPVDSLGPGTSILPIKASDGSGRAATSTMIASSGDYAGKSERNDAQYPAYMVNPRGLDLANSDGCGTPSPEAIGWLGAVRSGLGEHNDDGKPVPAIALQHIPPQGFYDRLKEVPAWIPNVVEGVRTHANYCYVFNHKICRPGSRLGEAIGCADENVGEADALCEAGGYSVLFCGHNYKNAFVGHVHGIDLGYAPTCGFECHGPKSRYRGIRLFEFRKSNPASYVTHMLIWGDLVGRYSSSEVRVWFKDHCVTGATNIRNGLCRPQVFAVLTGAMSLSFMAVIRSLVKKR